MKKFVISILLLLSIQPAIHAQNAVEIIDMVIESMGGQERWDKVNYIRSRHIGHKYWLEQSENPNGPFITSYEVVEELRSVKKSKLWRKESTRQFQSKEATDTEVILHGERGLMKFGKRSFPMPYQLQSGYMEWLRYAPERLIFDAQKSKVRLEEDQTLDGTLHYVLSYTKDQLKHQLFINKHTLALTQAQIESFLPYDLFNYPWGEFTTTIKYSLHWLYQGGFRYPAQWDVYKLGKHFRSSTIVDIDFTPEVTAETFAIPTDLPPVPPPVLVNKMSLNLQGLIKVAENVHTFPGMWYVGHIEQQDGILVIEGPISSGYNEQHLSYLKEQFPNKRVKAVISTSDAWPHLGGIRAFAAKKIPIYTHRLNETIIRQVLEADHSPLPDTYENSRSQPVLRLVHEPLTLEDSKAPVRVIPVNGEGGERMIALYLPVQKVLYASDLVQYNGRSKRFFSPQYLSEIKKLVDQYQLEVETVFAMHTSPLPWQEVLNALKEFEK